MVVEKKLYLKKMQVFKNLIIDKNRFQCYFQQIMAKMFRPLAVIPLSVARSKILKNFLLKYRVNPENCMRIKGWDGGRMNF